MDGPPDDQIIRLLVDCLVKHQETIVDRYRRDRTGAAFDDEPVAAFVAELKEHLRRHPLRLAWQSGEQQRADAARRQAEDRLSLIQEAAGVASWEWSIPTGHMACFGRATDVFGRTPGDYADWMSSVHPADKPALEQLYREMFAGRKDGECEYRYLWPDGSEQWLLGRVHVHFDAAGRPERMYGINLNINKRKQIEDGIRRSEANFRLLAEASPQFVWTATASGQIDYFNGRWFSYTGRSAEESYQDRWVEALHPDDVETTLAAWKKATSTGQPFEFEHRLRRHDGVYRWYLCRAVVVHDESKPSHRWLGLSVDIEEHKVLQEQLTRAKAAAEEASRAKSAFLANMSHEIRTPLGAIIGFSELLKEDGLAASDRGQFLEAIARNGHELSRLIDDILDLSKVEAGHLGVEQLAIDLPALLADVVSSLSPKAEPKSVKLSLRISPDTPELIRSDPLRLRQILMNIVGNAIKFTAQGSVVIDTALEAAADGGKLLAFSVRDTGTGLSAEAQQRIFQPFTQADPSTTRQYGGTGLGLILSRKLARALGGDVVLVESAPNKGSVFKITVAPSEQPLTAQDLYPAPPQRPPPASDRRLCGVQVLLAEDSVDNQLLISRILHSAGAKVAVVDNGADAIEHAKRGSYDVVLMDIQMPILDGYQATDELRRWGYRGAIIALTAHALHGEREKSLRSGCNDHLTKPVDQRQLIHQVSRYARAGASAPALTSTLAAQTTSDAL